MEYIDEFSHLRYTEGARALLSYVCVKKLKKRDLLHFFIAYINFIEL